MHGVIQQGCVLSPFAMGVKPWRGNFPQRNRIISGLCLGTVVVEAPPGSGATAHGTNSGRNRGEKSLRFRGGWENGEAWGLILSCVRAPGWWKTVEDVLNELPMLQEACTRPKEKSTEVGRPSPTPPRKEHGALSAIEQEVLEDAFFRRVRW